MIHSEMYDLNCPYDIHYICDMTLTYNGASHCICTEAWHFMGVNVWLESTPQLVIDGWAQCRWTKSNRVAWLHEMVRTCVGLARRARHSLG